MLCVDGFNVLTTIEAALGGGVVLACADGCYRDVASVHGTWRRVAETPAAVEHLGALLAGAGVEQVVLLLDAPVGNSGRLATLVGELAEARGWPWHVAVVADPDRELAQRDAVVATADSVILDHGVRWVNLAREAVAKLPRAWLVDLAPGSAPRSGAVRAASEPRYDAAMNSCHVVHDGAARAGVVLSAIAWIGLAGTATAQCATSWSGSPPPNLIGTSFATCTWDPDGGGPLPSKLVAAYYVPAPPLQIRQAIAALDTASLTWTTLAASEPATIFCMLPMPNGDLLVGGNFSFFSGPIDLARFNGTSWSQFATLVHGQVFALARLPNGDVVVGGDFSLTLPFAYENLARWDGSAWHAMTPPATVSGNTPVQALAVLPNGDLVVSSASTLEGVARWDGTAWHSMGAGLGSPPQCFTVLPDGSVFAGGAFTGLGPMARFDGSAWQPFGGGANSSVLTSTLLPNGDLLVGGAFSSIGGVGAQGIARWDGTTWWPLGPGFGIVRSVSAAPDGRILAGGIGFVANAASTCAPTVASVPTACIGPAGPVTLAAETYPWLGATFVSRASGFTSTSLEVAILGFASVNVPLSAIHPTGLPNCDLLASPDLLALALPVAGSATYTIPLPNAASLLGVQLFHQFTQVALDPQAAIVSLSSSNALTLTLGDY